MRRLFDPRAVILAVAIVLTLAVGMSVGAVAPTITPKKGTPQSTKIGTPFKILLVAHVVGTAGHPAAGLLVRFTAPSTGAGATLGKGKKTAVRKTNKNGNAKITATANSLTGTYKVVANLRNHPLAHSATFSLKNTP